jgi:hypothetical protein
MMQGNRPLDATALDQAAAALYARKCVTRLQIGLFKA